jgi:predicted pyridoxine 5'-phosphate oxidase superfamily flavin-nucleotide-binding protein
VSGTALLARDPDLLATMAVNGKLPNIAMIVRVKEAFFHCGKSMIRSGMWEPGRWGSVDGLPTYAQALKDHGAPESLADLQAMCDFNEARRLY